MRSCAAVLLLLLTLISSGPAQDTVHVQAGWNIIGSVSAGAIPDIITTDPPGIITTSFFGYAPGTGYQSADTLGKGLGYWIKVSADGLIIFEGPATPGSCGTKTVTYAGTTYHTVLVGSQCWLLENLDAGAMVNVGTNQTDNGTIEKYCQGNNPLNCVMYGGLYQWNEAMQYDTAAGARGICPSGWHIPSLSDYQALLLAVSNDGNGLKAVGQGSAAGAGTNTSGFAALLAGSRNASGYFTLFGAHAFIWGSPEFNSGATYYLDLDNTGGGAFVFTDDKNQGFSVRCLED